MMKGDQAWMDCRGPKVSVMSVSLSLSVCLSVTPVIRLSVCCLHA